MRRYTFVGILLLSCLIAFCTSKSRQKKLQNLSKEKKSEITVNIPDPPSKLELPDKLPEKYENKHYSIAGVFFNGDDLVDKDIIIDGIIVDTYKCPCKKEKKDDVCKCKKPHFYLVDKVDSLQKLLIVGYSEELEKDLKKVLDKEPNPKVTLKGKFSRTYKSGFLSMEGLLVLNEVVTEADKEKEKNKK